MRLTKPLASFSTLYEAVSKASRIVANVDEVQPGDLFVAQNQNRPIWPLARLIWNMIESLYPPLLEIIIRLALWLRLTIWLKANLKQGNIYADRALSRGATMAVIDNPDYCRSPKTLLVPDVNQTLRELALHHRQQFQIPVVAVTGSNGKTTTRELIRLVLGSKYQIPIDDGMGNSTRSIARNVLMIRPETEIVVFEMGIIQRGELAKICAVAAPTCGLITNIGYAHLDRLKTIDGVQAAKGELFEYLKSNGGHIFLNLDDPRVVAEAGDYGPITTYGQAMSAQIRGELLSVDPYLRIRCYLPTGESVEINTQLGGGYNLNNVLAAVTVGIHFDIPLPSIVAAIESCEPLQNRSQLVRSGTTTLFFDAHNANPSSMAASLAYFGQLTASRKVLILGEMLDLGSHIDQAHRQVIQQAKVLSPQAAVFIGPGFRRVRDPQFGLYFNSTAEARHWYKQQNFQDTYVLFKGSHGVRVEKVLLD